MIVIEHLNKAFDGSPVLQDWSMRIDEGERVCLMGASGCGKTTLTRILAGLERADAGMVRGVPEKIAVVFQEDRLCEPFNALRNTCLAGKYDPKRAKTLLTAMGLTDEDLRKPVRELSGGMRRRVAIARALFADAPLIILDEAFKGLDDATRAVAAETLIRFAPKTTLLSVTHDAREADLLGARIVKMEKASR